MKDTSEVLRGSLWISWAFFSEALSASERNTEIPVTHQLVAKGCDLFHFDQRTIKIVLT